MAEEPTQARVQGSRVGHAAGVPERNDEDADGQRDDRSLRDLDDIRDREELRTRYYGLLQELRVVLPGVQVLLAFLLTAPFAQRFEDLDRRGRSLYAAALLTSLGAVIALLAPTILHRLGDRRARRARLQWSIRLMVVGMALLSVSLLSATWCVTRLVWGPETGEASVIGAGTLVILLWMVLPALLHRHSRAR
jgi:drug/metabolite transporter (DMT)-like permease